MSRWVRWSTELLISPKWSSLPIDEFGVFSKLVLLAAVKDPPGKVCGTLEQIASAVNADADLVRRAFDRLIEYGTLKQRKDGYAVVNFATFNPAARYISSGRRPGNIAPPRSERVSVAGSVANTWPRYETIRDDTKRILDALYEARGLQADPGEDEARVERLLADFPDRDVLNEAKKAADWTQTSRRPVKNFWLFFRNWLERSAKVARDKSPDEIRRGLEVVS